MKLAISSGKGGVGKTLVATCLASVLARREPVQYIDCDVEAPNGHLFLIPDSPSGTDQAMPCITGVDPERCVYCGECARACYFHALAVGRANAIAFPELCRWCGACLLVCPTRALTVGERTFGRSYQSRSGTIDLHWATLAAGAGGMTVRLIEQLKQQIRPDALAILDSAPGTSCAVVHTLRDADRVVLVSDPTRFGMHDLKLSVHLCRSMAIEPLVLINRAGIGDLVALRDWCRQLDLTIVGELPDDRRIAELYSQGILPVEQLPELAALFEMIASAILDAPVRLPAGRLDPGELFFPLSAEARTEPVADTTAGGTPLEIVVVSGKGGTGKTSLAACFAQLAGATLADCDVDAADLHLLLAPRVLETGIFTGGRVMVIDPDRCTHCGKCVTLCQWEAIDGQPPRVDAKECEGCGACRLVCPSGAISERLTDNGRWYWSATRLGPLSHATLEPGEENSGKLVTLVRKQASEKGGGHQGVKTILLDGSPGTGCPVIASIGGTRAAVVVTEPTVSGRHDLERILELTAHFKVRAGVVINKADINPEMADSIRAVAEAHQAAILGDLPYDTAFIEAQQQGQTVLEYQPDGALAQRIRTVWQAVTLLAHSP